MGERISYTTDYKMIKQTYIVSKYKPLWRFDNYWNMSTSQSRIFHTCLALVESTKERAKTISDEDIVDITIGLEWMCEIFNGAKLEKYRKELASKNGFLNKEAIKLFSKKRTDKNRVLKQDILRGVKKWENINCWTYMGDDNYFRHKKDELGFVLCKGDSFEVFDTIEIVERGKNGKYIHIVINPKFNKFIFPKGNFVSYNFRNITGLNAKYSIRYISFYEQLLDLRSKNGYTEGGQNASEKLSNQEDEHNKKMDEFWNCRKYPMVIACKRFLYMMNLDENMNYGQLKANFLDPCRKKIISCTNVSDVYFGKYDYSYPHAKFGVYKNLFPQDNYLYFIIQLEQKKDTDGYYIPNEFNLSRKYGDVTDCDNYDDDYEPVKEVKKTELSVKEKKHETNKNSDVCEKPKVEYEFTDIDPDDILYNMIKDEESMYM